MVPCERKSRIDSLAGFHGDKHPAGLQRIGGRFDGGKSLAFCLATIRFCNI